MTKQEIEMISFGCPECGSEIELYETNIEGTGGKYRCNTCGRDTSWAVGKCVSFTDITNDIKIKINKS